MRCTTCQADNTRGSYVCHACLRPLAMAGEGGVAAMPAFGSLARAPRSVRQPTPWTGPLQVTVAIYLLLTAIVTLLAMVLGQEHFQRALVTAAIRRGSAATGDQLVSAASTYYDAAVVVASLTASLKALLAAAGFMRWSWVFVVDMVLLVLSTLASMGTVALLGSAGYSNLGGQEVVSVVVDLGAICLVAWMAVAASRYGVWACREIPVAG